jgi:aminodeoxyfutalosine synthase
VTAPAFDDLMARVSAGEPLAVDEVDALAAAGDILLLGMLADAVRRRLHGTRTTFVRVASCPYAAEWSGQEITAARELHITGSPATLDDAVEAVARAKASAGGRWVAGFTWGDVVRWADGAVDRADVLGRLREGGLDALAEVPIDLGNAPAAVASLAAAGFTCVRLTVERPGLHERIRQLHEASELRRLHPCVEAIDPLPTAVSPSRPTTGYEDVRMVAVARLAAPGIPHVQVDWRKYGPKLAQVALTFGADDVYGVSASEEAAEGPRRAALAEIRRNIEAAGLVPAERDGRFGPAA